MPFTSGDDTVTLSSLDGDIDGLAGNDLLILTAPTTYLDAAVLHFGLRALTFGLIWQIRYEVDDGTPINSAVAIGSVRNIEHFDLSATTGYSVGFSTESGNDTLRGSDLDDLLSAGTGANLVLSMAGSGMTGFT